MKIVHLDQVPKVLVETEGAKNAFKQIPISRNDGAPNFSFRVFTLEPKGYTPKHRHPYEHVNYIISGKGTIYSEEKGELEIQAGDFILVLPDELHQYKNTSESEPFVMICAVPKEFE